MKEDLEARRSAAASEAAQLRSLIEHPGWKWAEAQALEQARYRQATVCLSPLKSYDEGPAQEFMKGEAAGLGLFPAIVRARLEQLELEVKRLNDLIELEEANERGNERDFGASRVDDPDFSAE